VRRSVLRSPPVAFGQVRVLAEVHAPAEVHQGREARHEQKRQDRAFEQHLHGLRYL
jgi:hypothetical protein